MKMSIVPFEKYTQTYEDWFEKHRFAYESELEAVKALLPKGKGVEIGVGSGRFAGPLGIKFGVEPSPKMREIAEKKEIEVVDGVAENLPYDNETFDYALMVTTLCFLDDVDVAFREIYRILKPEGHFINGFIDRESKLGKLYMQHKQENVFYRVAHFYSIDNVISHLTAAGFRDFDFRQTIFQDLNEIKSVELIKPGYGKGSFVVVKAKK